MNPYLLDESLLILFYKWENGILIFPIVPDFVPDYSFFSTFFIAS